MAWGVGGGRVRGARAAGLGEVTAPNIDSAFPAVDKELADLTVAAGGQWLTELSDKELKNLFSPAGR